MPSIPLGTGAYKRDNGIIPEVKCLNMYLEKDVSGLSPDQTLRIQRPGLVLDYTYSGPIRAAYRKPDSGSVIVVSGNTAYLDRVALTGNLPGIGIDPIVSTSLVTVILDNGVPYFASDTALTAIALPDDAPDDGFVQDIDQLNGYILLQQPSGRFYWIVPGDTTVDPLNFATAESSSDGAVAIRRLGDEFFIFGTSSTEVWQVTGDANAPFQRASGRLIERGCLARDSVLRFDNTLMFAGDDCSVYRVSQVPQVVSDPGISERIRKRTGDLSAWTFGLDSHDFYVLRIDGEGTFAYDASTQQWSQFASPSAQIWAPWVGFGDGGEIYAGSSLDGSYYRVSADATNDAGTAFERTLTATVPVIGVPPRNDSLSIGTGSSADATIKLRWKDGNDDYPAYADELPIRAGIDIATMYRLGQPDQPYRTFEVSCTDDVLLRIAGAVVNQSWS